MRGGRGRKEGRGEETWGGEGGGGQGRGEKKGMVGQIELRTSQVRSSESVCRSQFHARHFIKLETYKQAIEYSIHVQSR